MGQGLSRNTRTMSPSMLASIASAMLVNMANAPPACIAASKCSLQSGAMSRGSYPGLAVDAHFLPVCAAGEA